MQTLPVSLADAWDYFSSPVNLQKITPPAMGFKIISAHQGEKMYAGQIIEYKVKPVLGIPIYWMTEITHVKEHTYFVDEQRYGPYSLWHHQHHFKEANGQVEMTDIVHYKLPLWVIGDIANRIFVKQQLKSIFDYRFGAVEKMFREQVQSNVQ
ncbi:MAG: SRPBCC family protein [Ferruginibacter sp.]